MLAPGHLWQVLCLAVTQVWLWLKALLGKKATLAERLELRLLKDHGIQRYVSQLRNWTACIVPVLPNGGIVADYKAFELPSGV